MYKISNYNWIVPYNEKLIYFNAISKKSFVLSCSEHEKMRNKFDDLITFDLEYPSIFRQFKEWGFIVEDGLDEINCIKLDYMNEVLNNRDYKLSILPEECVDDEFISSVSNHLQYMCEKENITSLNIEFFVNANFQPVLVDAIDSIITLVNKLCEEYSIDLKVKFVIDNTDLSQSIIELMVKHKVKSICFNILLHQTKEFKFDLHKDIVTLFKYIKDCNVVLKITYDDRYSIESFDAFLSNIDKKVRKYVSIDLSYCNSSDKDGAMNKRLVYKKIDESKFKKYIPESNELTFVRAFQNTITTSLKVRLWSNSYELDDLGVLQCDGTITWNRFKRDSLLGRIWFDNKMCTQCKCLPILLGTCSAAIKYNGNSIEMACIMQDKSLRPESIIVQLHETQNK